MPNEQTHWASMKTALPESTENAKKILLLRINSTSASTVSHMDTHCPEIWFQCHTNLQTHKLHKKNKNLVQLYSTVNGTRQVRKSNVKCCRFKSFLQELFIRVSWTLNIYIPNNIQPSPSWTKFKMQKVKNCNTLCLVIISTPKICSASRTMHRSRAFTSHYTRLSSSGTIETNPNSLSGFVSLSLSLSLCVRLFSATEKKNPLHHNHDNFSMTRKHSLFLNKENKTL
jgi:hypothetical protein